MKRSQLEHAIRTSCQIIRQQEVIVVGSQAILGTYDENQLPAEATMSLECDILPIASSNEETARLADAIEGVAGEWSPFEREHGFSIDGVDLTTVILPVGWRTRLVKVQNENTAALSGQPQLRRRLVSRQSCRSANTSRASPFSRRPLLSPCCSGNAMANDIRINCRD